MLDLFAGAGGMTAGLRDASPRFETVGAVELDPSAAASFEATFGHGVIYVGDIRSWLDRHDVPSADLVIGGPPCQGFSALGKQDIEDERNFLWREYVSTIRRATPKYFVVENVAEFRRSPQYQLFENATAPGGIISDYGFVSTIVNAANFGVAQARRRTLIIGYHRDLGSPGFPHETHSAQADERRLPRHRTVADALAPVPIHPDRNNVLDMRKIKFHGRTLSGPYSTRDLHWSRTYTELSRRRFEVIPAGGNRRDLEAFPDLMPPCWTKHKSGSGDVMGRLRWNKPSVTIRTEFFKPEKGRYLHPMEDRAITHYEAALLQGFGPAHKFVGSRVQIARQIGNAVPIPLGAAVGRLLEPLL